MSATSFIRSHGSLSSEKLLPSIESSRVASMQVGEPAKPVDTLNESKLIAENPSESADDNREYLNLSDWKTRPKSTVWQCIPSKDGLRIKRTPLSDTLRITCGGFAIADRRPKHTFSDMISLRRRPRILAKARKARDTTSPSDTTIEFDGMTDVDGKPVSRRSTLRSVLKEVVDYELPAITKTATWGIANEPTKATFTTTRGRRRIFPESIDDNGQTATLGTVTLHTKDGGSEEAVKVTCSDQDAMSRVRSGRGASYNWNKNGGLDIRVSDAVADMSEAEKLLVLAATESLLHTWGAGTFSRELGQSLVPIRNGDYVGSWLFPFYRPSKRGDVQTLERLWGYRNEIRQ